MTVRARGHRWAARAAAAALLCCTLATADPRVLAGGAALEQASAAQEAWAAEFEEVCSKTQDAMTLSSDELRALISRCDALNAKIDVLDPSRRKVYAKRLQQCRELYVFVLSSREKA